MRATRRAGGRATDFSDFSWTTPPVCEFLETRRLLAGDIPVGEIAGKTAKLALVHQELHRPPTACVADVNGDGADDLLLPTARLAADGQSLDVGLDVYFNDGRGNLRLVGHTDCDDGDDQTLAQPEVAVGDFNKDGFADVALKLFSVTGQPTPVGEASNEQYRLVLFGGNGKGEFAQGPTLDLAHRGGSAAVGAPKKSFASRISGLAAADLDKDGAVDVVSWVDNSVVMFAAGPRQTTSLDGSFSHSPTGNGRLIGAGDIDCDGTPDLLAVVDGSLLFATYDFASGEKPTAKVNKIEALTIKQGVRVAVGDLDGDGFVDDLALIDAQSITIGLNNLPAGGVATPTFKWTQVEGPLAVRPEEVLVGDIDGDGKDELTRLLESIQDESKSFTSIIR